jgi:hypothetical protein
VAQACSLKAQVLLIITVLPWISARMEDLYFRSLWQEHKALRIFITVASLATNKKLNNETLIKCCLPSRNYLKVEPVIH